MDDIKDFERALDAITRVNKTLPEKAATLAVNFFKRRFQDQNWVDHITEPWKQRKEDLRKRKRGNRLRRGILTKTARLRRSIRKIKVTEDTVLIGTDVPYARVHNEGFRGIVDVKEHKRKKSRKEKRGTGVYSTRTRKERQRTVKVQDGEITVKAHKRKMNMPRRQYMGRSAVLEQQLVRMITAEYNRALK